MFTTRFSMEEFMRPIGKQLHLVSPTHMQDKSKQHNLLLHLENDNTSWVEYNMVCYYKGTKSQTIAVWLDLVDGCRVYGGSVGETSADLRKWIIDNHLECYDHAMLIRGGVGVYLEKYGVYQPYDVSRQWCTFEEYHRKNENMN